MPDGKVLFQRYGKDDTEHNYSVSRIELNKFLLNAAADAGAELHFDHALVESSDFKDHRDVGAELHFRTKNGDLRVNAACPVIACDGAGSRARYALGRSGLTEFSEDLLTRGYKEVLFPKPENPEGFGAKVEDGGEPCDGRFGLHIWPRGDHMLMALANRDGSFTGTFYMDNEGEESFASFSDTPEGRAKCSDFCQKHYSEAIPLVGGLDSLVNQIVQNPTGLLGTVRTSKWAVKGKVLLIGDSCHAMVPFFGQGCNCGFEDTLWLSRLVDEFCCDEGQANLEKCTGDNFAKCFAAVEAARKPSADAICDMALENFVEMRDKTGDAKFQVARRGIRNNITILWISLNIYTLRYCRFESHVCRSCYVADPISGIWMNWPDWGHEKDREPTRKCVSVQIPEPLCDGLLWRSDLLCDSLHVVALFPSVSHQSGDRIWSEVEFIWRLFPRKAMSPMQMQRNWVLSSGRFWRSWSLDTESSFFFCLGVFLACGYCGCFHDVFWLFIWDFHATSQVGYCRWCVTRAGGHHWYARSGKTDRSAPQCISVCHFHHHLIGATAVMSSSKLLTQLERRLWTYSDSTSLEPNMQYHPNLSNNIEYIMIWATAKTPAILNMYWTDIGLWKLMEIVKNTR